MADAEAGESQVQSYDKEVLIRTSDLSPEQECLVVRIANSGIEQFIGATNMYETQRYSKMAAQIKANLDGEMGPGWHVFCGKNFGTFVTHQVGTFMHFSFDDLHVCIFKAA